MEAFINRRPDRILVFGAGALLRVTAGGIAYKVRGSRGRITDYTVTFVDNHDTQYGQSLQSFGADWFKSIAYAMILLRESSIPGVFYSDYYGNPVQDRPPAPNLGKMVKIRRGYTYGDQEDYFDDPHIVGWVRRGVKDHPESGLAVVISNTGDGEKRMCVGRQHAGLTFRDAMGNCPDPVVIDAEGWGIFRTRGVPVTCPP